MKVKLFKSKYLVNLSLVSSLAIFSINANASTIIPLSDWTAASTLSSFSPAVPTPIDSINVGVGDYLWYCPPSDTLSCPGDQGPNQVEFQLSFDLPAESKGYVLGNIRLFADDYFSLYVNGKFVAENWFDNTGTNPTSVDISSYLYPGQQNVIDIFACNGYPDQQQGGKAGPTLDGGLSGCINPASRYNNYLAVSGNVTEFSLESFPVKQVGLDGEALGDPNGWQVRTVLAVPEPTTLALLASGLLGFGAASRKSGRVG